MLPFEKVSWRSKALLNTGAAIVVAAMIVGSWPERRPFALFRSNLSGQWILKEDVREARLRFANLTGARLSDAYLQLANLRGTNQTGANLIVANLRFADLTGADMRDANLTGADLSGVDFSLANLSVANLSGADLSGANLTGAKNLTQEQLDKACGNADTKPPGGLTLKAC